MKERKIEIEYQFAQLEELSQEETEPGGKSYCCYPEFIRQL